MKNILFLAIVWLLIPLPGYATSIESKRLEDLVLESDHVMVATVVKVDMVDGAGKAVEDVNAMTGPGLDTEIRLHLEVKEVLFSESRQPPKRIMVRLWKAWNFQLGDIQNNSSGTSIFLLKGEEYDPVYPAQFEQSLGKKEEILSLINKKSGHNK